jgi:phage protein U
MLLSLGDFRFSVDTAAYDALDLNAEYPWAKVERLGNAPQLQAMGKERRTMTLRGVAITTYKGGSGQPEALRAIAGKMEPLELVSGDGKALGKWCVMKISESESNFFSDGVPKKQAYTLELERFSHD